MRSIGILGTGAHLGSIEISNFKIAETIDKPHTWVKSRIGMDTRFHSKAGESTLTHAICAGREALDATACAISDIKLIVVATSTPDQPIPGIACRVQHALQLDNAVAFDVNAACASFLVAANVAKNHLMCEDDQAKALVIGADNYSSILDSQDRTTFPLFGDGAGAVIFGMVPDKHGILSTQLVTDGSLWQGATGGPSPQRTTNDDGYVGAKLSMNGRRIAEVVENHFARLVQNACELNGIDVSDIDHFVCHQANPNLILQCAAEAGLDVHKFVMTGQKYGNTAAASLPIGLAEGDMDLRFRTGDLILMVTFGAGMTWGSMLINWIEGGRI
jgi:3-oxoacyl-(acyl-carrier-protein) synthase III